MNNKWSLKCIKYLNVVFIGIDNTKINIIIINFFILPLNNNKVL